ncbi:hypothetical protein [Streptomyces sp. TE33382]
MRTGDGVHGGTTKKGHGPGEGDASLPVAPIQWPSFSSWLVIVLLPAAVFGVLWLFSASDVQKLREGEPAVLTGVGRCVTGGINTGKAGYCTGGWRFAGGREGSGRIQSESAEAGDSAFAGEDWASTSKAQAMEPVIAFALIGLSTLVVNTILWVNQSRSDRRERTFELRRALRDVPHADTPDPTPDRPGHAPTE